MNDPNLFSLKFNHGGGFSYVYGPNRTRAPRHVYKGGNADWFDDVDADGFSVIEASCMLKELAMCISLKLIELFIEHPVDKCVLDNSVIDLDQKDNSVIDGLESHNTGLGTHESEALENDNAGLGTNKGEGVENDNAGLETQESEGIDNDNVEELDPLDDNEESDDTKESEDSNFECDIGDRIDDVHVDIECDLDDIDIDIDPNEMRLKERKL
ncbi:hypothetical protein Tco_0814604 [Tanacetum coccineum]